MNTLTVFGGTGEVGGNQILLQDQDTRIFLDFGMRFSIHKDYYMSIGEGPRLSNGIGDYLEFGLIPPIDGIYREDLNVNTALKSTPVQCDGVIISHAHFDHIGYISLLNPEIPIFSSPETKAIVTSLERTLMSSMANYISIAPFRELGPYKSLKKEKKWKRLQKRDIATQRKWSGKSYSYNVGELEIQSLPVDHSLPGAIGSIISTTGGEVVYTGDLRLHGIRSQTTKEFLKKAADSNPKIMICEGTNVTERKLLTEEGLREKVSQEIEKIPRAALVIVNFPTRDIERLTSFHIAAKKSDRTLVISLYQADLLKELSSVNADVPSLDDLLIFIPKSGWGLYKDEEFKNHIQRTIPELASNEELFDDIVMRDYSVWQRKFINENKCITATDLREEPGKYVWYCPPYGFSNLIDVQPPRGSVYIRSVVEPFDEFMDLQYERDLRWLDHFHLQKDKQIHCSGHAYQRDLEYLIKLVNPEILIPVHTEEPQSMKTLGKKIGVKTIIPKYGQQIRF